MSCRKPCKECPWVNVNSHSLKFRTYVEKMMSLGKIVNHKCHMVSKDVWGYETAVDEKNICQGQAKRQKKNNK